jgi:hypothetical protein
MRLQLQLVPIPQRCFSARPLRPVASRWRSPTSPPPLQWPLRIVWRRPCSFTIRVGSWDKIVSVSRLKACTEVDATPGSLRCCGQPPGKCLGGPAATKRVLFSDLLVSSPSLSPAPPSNGPGTIFPVIDWFFARPGPAAPSQSPQQWYPHRQKSPPQRLDLWPLLQPADARAQGEPCGDLATPLVDGQTSWVNCTTLVHSLYISCYVFSNKLLLSYLLLCLLLQTRTSTSPSNST